MTYMTPKHIPSSRVGNKKGEEINTEKSKVMEISKQESVDEELNIIICEGKILDISIWVLL